jgi:predicted DNA-binding transcriptional regulator AlpA
MGNKLRKKAVAAKYGITERSVDRWSLDGRLPQPVHRGRVPLWDQGELDACDRAHAARSRAEQTSA